MNSQLVDQLYERAMSCRVVHDDYDMASLLEEAADEIERLREIESDTAAYRGFCPNDGERLQKMRCQRCHFSYDPD